MLADGVRFGIPKFGSPYFYSQVGRCGDEGGIVGSENDVIDPVGVSLGRCAEFGSRLGFCILARRTPSIRITV